MTCRPVVSVITPAYNAAPFIGDTVRSVLAQTFGRWEMIIVDDGSSDDTVEQAVRAAGGDPRVRVIRGERRGQPAATRNRALSVARGRFLAFLDADDLWEPNKLRDQLRLLKKTGRGWAFGNVTVFGGGDGAPEGVRFTRDWRPARPFFPALLAGDGIPCATVIVRRDLLARVSPDGDIGKALDEDPRLMAVEDWDLAVRLSRSAEPAYLARPVARYRVHPGGISRNAEKHFERHMAGIRKHRRAGAPEPLCGRAEAIARSKRGVGRLFLGAGGWRGDLVRGCLLPPRGLRDLYLGALCVLPAGLARRMYTLGLGALRRKG